jgi:hypothetical protein
MPTQMSHASNDDPDGQHDLEAAEKLISRARDTAASATKIITAWGITLITIWLLTLEPLANGAVREKRARDLAQWDSVEQVRAQKRHDRLRTQFLKQASETGGPQAGTPAPREISVTDTAKSARALHEQHAHRAISKVPFHLGSVELDVPATLAALLWLATSLGLLWYLSAKRAEVLHLFSQAVAACRNCPETLQAKMGLWFSGAPSWLAPFPLSEPDTGIRVHGATGLRLDRGQSLLLPVLIFVGLLLLQLRVMWIGILACIGQDRAFPDGALATMAALTLFGATLAVTLRWWQPRKQAVDGKRPVDVSKRDFLLLVLWAPIAYAFASAGLSRLKRHRWPRWVHKEREVRPSGLLAAGFYVNPRSGIVHSVGPDGRILRLGKKAKLDRFKQVSAAQVMGLVAASAAAASTHIAPEAAPVPAASTQTAPDTAPAPNTASARAPDQRASGLLQEAPRVPPVAATARQPETSPRRERPPARVSFASYSLAYEAAALDHLRRGDPAGAAEMLLAAVRQNVDGVQRGRQGRINWRLYHLLGGVCLRFDLAKQYEELVGILNALKLDEAENLVAKWNNPEISWTKRWRDRTRPITFASNAPLHRLRF